MLCWLLSHLQLAKTYGNVFTLWFGWAPVIILNGFQAVKDGMTTHPEDVSGRLVSPFFRAMAKGKGVMIFCTETLSLQLFCSWYPPLTAPQWQGLSMRDDTLQPHYRFHAPQPQWKFQAPDFLLPLIIISGLHLAWLSNLSLIQH